MTHDHILHSAVLLGESLRRLRLSQDMTVQQAADAAHLSKSFISLVESGKRNIGFEDVLQLVHGLKMSLGWFVTQTRDSFTQSSLDAPLETAMTNIIRHRNEGIVLAGKLDSKTSQTHKTSPHLLLMRPLRHIHDLEVLELYLPPTSQLTSKPIKTLPTSKNIHHEVRGIVHSGTLLIVINNDEYRAKAGDEFCFDGTLPHLYRNYTTEPLTATLLISNGGL